MSRVTGDPSFSRLTGLRAVFALLLREMASTYGRSPGGYLWAIFDPLAGVVLLTVVFSLTVPAPPLGGSFALFYATGYLPFAAFSDLTMKIGQAIRYSRPLLAYPSVTYLDAILGRLLLNLGSELMVFILMIGGIHLWVSAIPDLAAGWLWQALSMLVVLVFGIGALNCYLFTRFALWERLWAIATRPLFFASGVFFLPDTMSPLLRDVVMWNPLTHVICAIRAGFYPLYEARLVSPAYVYAIGLTCIFWGLLLLRRHTRFLIAEGA